MLVAIVGAKQRNDFRYQIIMEYFFVYLKKVESE